MNGKWVRAMFGAFLLNGLAPFGLRILAGGGLSKEYLAVYLFYWYLSGLIFGLIWAFWYKKKVLKFTLLIGSAMAVASVGGQLFMGLAMAYGTPGNVVYAIAQGASICIVVAGGVLFFKERIGIYGKLGVLTGFIAAVLLGVWK
jgi:multidrug transporter EmrE-like cation transporter